MRRNAENLIVLSGGVAGRAWRRPVPMIDVVRAAVAEIEDYQRVNVLALPSAGLAGRAVGDVIHLLAELIENAAAFSPSHTSVQISGELVGNGYVVEVEDRGLGMGGAALAAANEQVRNPPEFQLSSHARLGLYVVGQLAARQGIQVHLRRSPYGGTTAIVLIPATLIATPNSDEPSQPAITANGSVAAAEAVPVLAGVRASAARVNGAATLPVLGQRGQQAPLAADALSVEAAATSANGAPDSTSPVGAPATEPPTVFGLPRRSRKLPRHAAANAVGAGAAAATARPHSPERVRTVIGAVQAGTQRTRSQMEPKSPQVQPIDAPTHSAQDPVEEPVAAAPAADTPDEQA